MNTEADIIPLAAELCKEFEGFRAKPYTCPGGVWTIGYGSTRDPRGFAVSKATPEMSEAVAEQWLYAHLQKELPRMQELIEVELEAQQEAALLDFVYNLGIGNFQSSTLLKRINARDFDDVPTQLRRWNKASGEELAGLTRRREAEIRLWSGE